MRRACNRAATPVHALPEECKRGEMRVDQDTKHEAWRTAAGGSQAKCGRREARASSVQIPRGDVLLHGHRKRDDDDAARIARARERDEGGK